MERLNFEIQIKTSPEKLFQVLFEPDSFAQWSKAFDPQSHVEGSWETGSLMRFLTYDSENQLCGLICYVRENIPHRKIHLDHVGVLQNGQEIFEGPEVESLKGASEIYHILPQGDHCLLQIESDAFDNLQDFFLDTWPVALQKIKALCE